MLLLSLYFPLWNLIGPQHELSSHFTLMPNQLAYSCWFSHNSGLTEQCSFCGVWERICCLACFSCCRPPAFLGSWPGFHLDSWQSSIFHFPRTLRSPFPSTVTSPSFFPLERHLWLLWGTLQKSRIVLISRFWQYHIYRILCFIRWHIQRFWGSRYGHIWGWGIIQSTTWALIFLLNVIFT